MNNSFCHVELTTDNPAQAKEFYAKLFAWKIEDSPGPGTPYTFIKPGDGPNGGIMKKPNPHAPTAWLPYVLVASVDETVGKAMKLGGKILMEKTPIPDMGAFAVLANPTGGVLGVWEASAKSK